jgi:hypothetical protein
MGKPNSLEQSTYIHQIAYQWQLMNFPRFANEHETNQVQVSESFQASWNIFT